MAAEGDYSPAAAPARRRVFTNWLAVYPTITVILWLLGPVIAPLPLYVRTLVMTGLAVPITSYGLVPLLVRADRAVTRCRRRPGS